MIDETEYGDEIVQLVRRIVRLSHVQSRRMVQRFGLTGPQLICMQALFRAGELTPTALARAVELSPATVTGIVHRLEARGMVQRTRSQVDRRSSVLTLTEEARETFATLPRSLESRFTERLQSLSEYEQASLINALRTLVDLMVEDSQTAPELIPPGAAGDETMTTDDSELPPQIGPHIPGTFDVRPDAADPKRTLR